MTIIFTSLHYGGMLQFTIQLAQAFQNIGHNVNAYIPNSAPNLQYDFIKKYTLPQKSITYIKGIRLLAKEIINLNPDKVIFSENSLLSCLILHELQGKVKTIMSVHDALIHPTNNKILLLREKIKQKIRERAYIEADYLLFMSVNVKDIFFSKYKDINKQFYILPLSAHVPKAEEIIPNEITSGLDYILFFGRIDKYKGLERLFRAYLNLLNNQQTIPMLVIAGKGTFTNIEEELIEKIKSFNKIIIINRFISDGEMKWLIKHCNFVCLPYIEASQSGVLPMAYFYTKPIIVSNLPGLTQFVVENQTGLIFNNVKDLENNIIKLYNSPDRKFFEKSIKQYFEENLNWENNLKKIFK